MKLIYTLLFVVFSTTLMSQSMKKEEHALPIMIKMKYDEKFIPKKQVAIVKMGLEEALTEKHYALISDSIQEEALKEQAKQHNTDCYDDACIMDTGKMLAAKFLLLIDILDADKVLFKVRYIDLETGTSEKVKSFIYGEKELLSDSEKLLAFSKKMVQELDLKEVKQKNVVTQNNVRQDQGIQSMDDWYIKTYGYIPAYVKMPSMTFGLSGDFYFVHKEDKDTQYLTRALLQFRIRETTEMPFSLWFEANFGFMLAEDSEDGEIAHGVLALELLQDLRVTIVDPLYKNSSYIDMLSIELKAGILVHLGNENDFGLSSKLLLNVFWFNIGANLLYTVNNKMTLGLTSGVEIGF